MDNGKFGERLVNWIGDNRGIFDPSSFFLFGYRANAFPTSSVDIALPFSGRGKLSSSGTMLLDLHNTLSKYSEKNSGSQGNVRYCLDLLSSSDVELGVRDHGLIAVAGEMSPSYLENVDNYFSSSRLFSEGLASEVLKTGLNNDESPVWAGFASGSESRMRVYDVKGGEFLELIERIKNGP